MRDQIVAGNWKMNKNLDQGLALVAEIQQSMSERSATANRVILAPPFIHLASVVQAVAQTEGLHLSAQNCHQEEAGGLYRRGVSIHVEIPGSRICDTWPQ